jgi:hypothetical protein
MVSSANSKLLVSISISKCCPKANRHNFAVVVFILFKVALEISRSRRNSSVVKLPLLDFDGKYRYLSLGEWMTEYWIISDDNQES